MKIPSDMTPEKLRTIAGWLDVYDKLVLQYLTMIEKWTDEPLPSIDEAREASQGTEIQDNLRRWADEIDSTLKYQTRTITTNLF